METTKNFNISMVSGDTLAFGFEVDGGQSNRFGLFFLQNKCRRRTLCFSEKPK